MACRIISAVVSRCQAEGSPLLETPAIETAWLRRGAKPTEPDGCEPGRTNDLAGVSVDGWDVLREHHLCPMMDA